MNDLVGSISRKYRYSAAPCQVPNAQKIQSHTLQFHEILIDENSIVYLSKFAKNKVQTLQVFFTSEATKTL